MSDYSQQSLDGPTNNQIPEYQRVQNILTVINFLFSYTFLKIQMHMGTVQTPF